MFHLIGEYYLTADPNCYIIGKPLERRGKGIEMKSARLFHNPARRRQRSR